MTRTEIDGVPVLWRHQEGPLTARIMFRTGTNDEPFVSRGWTHLVEHLALASLGRPAHDQNGQVGALVTSFALRGEPADVATQLQQLCRAISDLPPERLELEKNLLLVEAEERGTSFAGEHLGWRYGSIGAGSVANWEFGLAAASIGDLASWSRSRLVRGAAVLTLTGAPPPGLTLPLPEGSAAEVPRAVRQLPDGPFWASGANIGPCLSLDVPHHPDAAVLAAGLQARLLTVMREQSGLAYDPRVHLHRVDRDHQVLVATAGCRYEDEPEATQLLLTVLNEMEALASEIEVIVATPPPTVDVDREAVRDLFGDPLPVAGTATGALALLDTVPSMLLTVHRDDSAPDDWSRWVRPTAPEPVGALELELADPKAGKELELRQDGIVVRSAGGVPTRVALWQDVVGAVGYDDGYRSLHLASGLSFAVRPVEWYEDARLTPAVDAHLAGKLAQQGPRPEGALDAVERAVLQLRDATAGVSQARAERDRARRSLLKTFPLAVAAVSVVLFVLGAAVYALLKLAGVVPASAALLGVAALLLVGWRASRNDDEPETGRTPGDERALQ